MGLTRLEHAGSGKTLVVRLLCSPLQLALCKLETYNLRDLRRNLKRS